MSNCLQIIFVIGSCLTFGRFPSKFSKCCFDCCICSSWLVAFTLAFTVHFLLLTSFTVCYAILDCLSSTESLILSIWFCMYSVCSFRYMLANSFCVYLSFRELILAGLLLWHLEAVFMSARFFLTANVSHETLGLALCLVVCILLLLLSGHWRNSHIRHSEYVFLSSSMVHRICF